MWRNWISREITCGYWFRKEVGLSVDSMLYYYLKGLSETFGHLVQEENGVDEVAFECVLN